MRSRTMNQALGTGLRLRVRVAVFHFLFAFPCFFVFLVSSFFLLSSPFAGSRIAYLVAGGVT